MASGVRVARGMVSLSYFSLHFNADSWVSLQELSQAILCHLAWRVFPVRFMRWILELALTNFFLLGGDTMLFSLLMMFNLPC